MKIRLSSKPIRRLLVVVLLAYIATLLTLTHIPRPPSVFEKTDDKSLHFIAYGTLGGLSYLVAAVYIPRRPGLAMVILLACLCFGALDEITQPFFGRTADILDWRADAFGILFGVSFVAAAHRLTRKRLATTDPAPSSPS